MFAFQKDSIQWSSLTGRGTYTRALCQKDKDLKLNRDQLRRVVGLITRGTYTRAHCQKDEGSKIKQRRVKMGGRTVYRTLSPKRTPFQAGTNR
jgi:hypothetical protein